MFTEHAAIVIHVAVAYKPHVDGGIIAQWLKGISSWIFLQEFAHLRKQLWGRHLWAQGYLAVSTGTLTDEWSARALSSKRASLFMATVGF